MPAARTIDPVDLLQWERDGLTTDEMRQRLAEDGKHVSIELVRLRLREGCRASAGDTLKPKAERKSSATARRLQQVASSVDVLEELRDDLQNLVDSWGDSFAGTDRYQRFFGRGRCHRGRGRGFGRPGPVLERQIGERQIGRKKRHQHGKSTTASTWQISIKKAINMAGNGLYQPP